MNKLIVNCFVLIFISITIISCSKYEEGPRISFLSKEARITGDWKLSNKTINGIQQDISSNILEFTISKDGTWKGTRTFTVLGQVFTDEVDGLWEFSEDKTKFISIETGESYQDTLTIVRLANKELKLKSIDNTNSNTTIQTFKAK